MSGICDTCRREPCHMRFDGCKTCDVYEGGETRFEKLFGTPERAARTLSKTFIACEREDAHCDACPLFNPITDDCYYTRDYDVLLEWLKGGNE